MMPGWVKSYRSLMEHWVHEDPFAYRAWGDLLQLANHKENKIVFCGEPMTIKKGQHLTSMRKLSRLWNCDTKKVKRMLDSFKKDSMIEVQNVRQHATLITIVNYSVYQGKEEGNGNTNACTVAHTNADTNGNRVADAVALQTRMSKNDKNDSKEEKKNPRAREFETNAFGWVVE